MRKRLIAILFFALFWILFFFSARFFFIITHFGEASRFSFGSIAATFFYGLKLDISATGYIFLIPLLLMIPGVYITGSWFRIIMRWYTYLIIVLSACIVVSDTLLYKYWGFRMDITPLIYLKTPKDAVASVTTMQLIGVITGIVLISSMFIILYRKFIDKFFQGFERIKPWFPAIIFFMLLWGSLLIPIRGGVGLAPINAGSVYFSDAIFINHTAVNVVWNVGSSVINKKPSVNPYNFGDLTSAREVTYSLTKRGADPVKILNNQRPDILFIILESFGNELIGVLGGDSLTTPNFNRLSKEGVLFTNFYASGNRTDKAMPAILDGYPAQPAVSIMKEPKKTQSLPGIARVMEGKGYHSSFWYGGDIDFANFNSYVINSGFGQIITKDNFSSENYNSKWGVHDHILFEMLKDSLENVREPFLYVVLTLSSHEPFEVPEETVFSGSDEFTKFRNSIYYTDKTLGSFIEWAKNKDWWKNTLVILVADHYRKNSDEVMVYSEEIFRIPMLWLGGALSVEGLRIGKTGSQVDIPLTLMHQLGLDGDYPFAKDLLSDKSGSFAFYTFNEGFGFVTDSSLYIYDHKAGGPVVRKGADPELAGSLGKAYLQVLYEDYLKK